MKNLVNDNNPTVTKLRHDCKHIYRMLQQNNLKAGRIRMMIIIIIE